MAVEEDRRLGKRYVLEERIGRGAMGAVWRGRNTDSGEPVAIKFLEADADADPDILARFVQERNILVNLRHPNLVAVQNMVVEDERLALIMDLVSGGDLQRLLRTQGALEPASAVHLAVQICCALHAIHGAGIVHRDLKPANVLLDPATVPPTVRLADFGVARITGGDRITARTSIIGTPAYLAPELIHAQHPVPASDMYALGITLYELLTGLPPFTNESVVAVIQQHLHETAVRHPAIPDCVWPVIEACLRKDAAERPDAKTAAYVLAGALAELAPGWPVPLLPEAGVGPADPTVRIPRPRRDGTRVDDGGQPVVPVVVGSPPAPRSEAASGKRKRGRTVGIVAGVTGAVVVCAAVTFALVDRNPATPVSGANTSSSGRLAAGGSQQVPASGGTGTATSAPTGAKTPTPSGTASTAATSSVAPTQAQPTASGSVTPRATETVAVPAPGVNLALNAPVTVSSEYSGGGYANWSNQDITNGELAPSTSDMGWSSAPHGTPDSTEWFSVDLGSQQAFNEVDLYGRNDSGNIGKCFPVDFTISVSPNDTTWTTVVTESGYPVPGNGAQRFTFPTVNDRYVKVTATKLAEDQFDSFYFQLKQIIVY